MSESQLEITDNAYNRLAAMKKSKNNDKLMLRIAVDGGGCSGFMYNFELTETSSDDDVIFTRGDEIVVVDPMSLDFIKDSKFDYITELGSAYFAVTNPNATAKCGCGNSFAI